MASIAAGISATLGIGVAIYPSFVTLNKEKAESKSIS